MSSLVCYRSFRTNRGFTLVEIMVTSIVIAILAGLSGIGINQLYSFQLRAESNKIYTNLKYLQRRADFEQKVLGLKLNNDNTISILKLDHKLNKWTRHPTYSKAFKMPSYIQITLNLPQSKSIGGGLKKTKKQQPEVLIKPEYEISIFTLLISRHSIKNSVLITSDGFNLFRKKTIET